MTNEQPSQVFFWRRVDCHGLERLTLSTGDNRIFADATTIGLEDGGFRIDHRWELTPAWSVRSCIVEKQDGNGLTSLVIERRDDGWSVNRSVRADLEGAAEPDLSITPFCNSFPIRQMMASECADFTLDTVFIDAAKMTVGRSRQNYRRSGRDHFHYLDLGFANGFEAQIEVDRLGLVNSYEGLFERIWA